MKKMAVTFFIFKMNETEAFRAAALKYLYGGGYMNRVTVSPSHSLTVSKLTAAASLTAATNLTAAASLTAVDILTANAGLISTRNPQPWATC